MPGSMKSGSVRSVSVRSVSMRSWLCGLLLLLCVLSGASHAGTRCSTHAIGPRELAAAAESAQRVYTALEQRNAPVALIARHGQDLSHYGLYYSHVGFAVRDRSEGRWTVVHLLNFCGTDHSSLYAQGLVNFFADDLVNQDVRIVWLKPELAQRVTAILDSPEGNALHNPHYSVIARFDSRDYQNSTAWVLDVLAAAQLPAGVEPDRPHAQALELATNSQPDTIHIPYSKRILGGLFSANTVFTDHPLAARLKGEYRVVTVHSILRWLDAIGATEGVREWRDGIEMTRPGST